MFLNNYKMYKKTTVIILFICLCFQSYSQDLGQNDLEFQKKPLTQLEKKFIDYYFLAEKNKLLEEYREAVQNYENCINLNPEEAAPYYELSKIYLYVFNDIDEAEYNIKKALLISPSNKWYNYELLAIDGLRGRQDQQIDTYFQLISIEPQNQVYYFKIIQLLKDLGRYKKAIKFIKQSEKKFGQSEDFLRELWTVYLKQDDAKNAEKAAYKLIEKAPKNYSVLAETHMYFSNYEGAVAAYLELLKIVPGHPSALMALYKIYSNNGDIKNEEKYLALIAESQLINLESKKEVFYEILLKNTYNKYEQFQALINQALLIHSDEPLFHLILGDICAKQEDYDEAISHYWLSLYTGVVNDEYVYNKIIEIYWQKDNMDEVVGVSKEAIDRFPLSPVFYYYKGLALANQKKHTLSIEVLLKGKGFVFDNPTLLSDFYSLIGDSHNNLNNFKKSDEAYNAALKHNPENLLVLNNYSYYLSNRNENLELAKSMISRCIELTSNSPRASFIDTYAWVLYKIGEYKLAKEQIELAVSLNPESPVFLDHYGDILFKLGDIRRALLEWNKALALDKNNLTIKNKIKAQKLDE